MAYCQKWLAKIFHFFVFFNFLYGQNLPETIPLSKEKLTYLENIGYKVGYSETKKNPLWVSYRLKNCQSDEKYKRSPRFSIDFRTLAKVDPSEYTHTGYSRGHMAPSLAIFLCYGEKAKQETYYMSNIVPQKQSHNSGIWAFVEKLNLREHTKTFGEIYVITGPVFAEPITKYIGSGIAVPVAFYKITLAQKEGGFFALALLIPHEGAVTKKLREYITTIRKIEEKTDLNFFHELPDDIEEILETSLPQDIWALP